MRRPIAAALVILATALTTAAPVAAGASPTPGKLWSEFPLEPVVTTIPATPGPAQVVEQEQPRSAPGGAEGPAAWIFVLFGAAAAGAVGLGARFLRAASRQPNRESERKPEWVVPRTFERPVGRSTAAGASRSVAVADRPGALAATQAAPTLIETLTPQGRRAGQLEGREIDVEPETHQVCEIACWRGYFVWQFYVESQSPLGESFASPYFRAPGRQAPEQCDAALRAHALLVEKLVASDWEPEGYGDEWFAERFQRASR